MVLMWCMFCVENMLMVVSMVLGLMTWMRKRVLLDLCLAMPMMQVVVWMMPSDMGWLRSDCSMDMVLRTLIVMIPDWAVVA